MNPSTRIGPPESESRSPGGHLALHPLEFEKKFAREPFLIQHSLCGHPLFEVERILDLLHRLPEQCVEYNAGKLPISMDPALTPRNGMSPEETIRRIEECESWIVLKYVEHDPDYRRLLDECLAELRPYTEPITPGMTQAQAFVFITSPGSVTPYHIDPELNFLLQIQGSKQVHLFDGRDREILTHEDLENFYCDRGRNLQLQPQHEDKAWVFDLASGSGLHFPVTYPHYVRNGDAVSISFSITFRTPDLDRRRALYEMNGSLRGRGYMPWDVGRSSLRDTLLYNAFRIARRFRSFSSKK